MDDFLPTLQDFLRRTGLCPSLVGSAAVSDPNLYGDMLLGRQLRRETRQRLQEWMDGYTTHGASMLAEEQRRREDRARRRRERRRNLKARQQEAA